MKQILINSQGKVILNDVPVPTIGDNTILVQVFNSLISSGTELSEIGYGVTDKIKKSTAIFKKVKDKVSKEGLVRTVESIGQKLGESKTIGYSAAGVVKEVGMNVEGFSVGDRVACAGAGIANHAEYIDVPQNLAVKVPDEIEFKGAAFVTLGSIALQGVRRLNPTLGEIIVVVGLGLLGQLTLQILKANGCRIIGIDVLDNRLELAKKLGAEKCYKAGNEIVSEILFYTENIGADGVIITAGTESSVPVNQAFEYTREKGRIVVVGAVGLELERKHFYLKEQDLFISRSYGPGRYDESYERRGEDYPLPYVRWTENRNMTEFIRLVADKKVDVKSLITAEYPLSDAFAAYRRLKENPENNLAVLLKYSTEGIRRTSGKKVSYIAEAVKSNKVRMAVIGGGEFASKVHLPNLRKLKNFHISAIVDRIPQKAADIVKRYKAGYATTDYKEVLADSNIDAVLISTRHNLHYPITIAAAGAGKHIYLEKPMALTYKNCKNIIQSVRDHEVVFQMGYNRRYSILTARLKAILKNKSGNKVITYRVNAGSIPREHWVNDPVEGGGRIIGECCHFLDLMSFILEEDIVGINAAKMDSKNRGVINEDNFSASIAFSNGSVGNLVYTSMGNTSFSKERIEVFAKGQVLVIDDFRKLLLNSRTVVKKQDKGYLKALEQFEVNLKCPSEKNHENYLSVMEWTFDLVDKVRQKRL